MRCGQTMTWMGWSGRSMACCRKRVGGARGVDMMEWAERDVFEQVESEVREWAGHHRSNILMATH